MRTRERRGLLVVAGVTAGVLTLASVAAACIPYRGKMEVKGFGHKATSVEVTGSSQGMTYCHTEPYGPDASLPNAGDAAGRFEVKVKPYLGNKAGECRGQLLGNHGVRFWSGSATPLGTERRHDHCFPWNNSNGDNPADNPSVKVGELFVGPTGVAKGVFEIPAGAQPGYGAVCLINIQVGFLGGHRAPIFLL